MGDLDLRGAIGTAIFVANPCHPAHHRRRWAFRWGACGTTAREGTCAVVGKALW